MFDMLEISVGAFIGMVAYHVAGVVYGKLKAFVLKTETKKDDVTLEAIEALIKNALSKKKAAAAKK